ncbi:MAG: DUF378 domain-containing protein [Patescibacteria group bacterium]
MKRNPLDWIAFILLVIGGLNWGLVGIFDYNLVAKIFGDTAVITKIIYILVAVSALYALLTMGKKPKSETAKPPTQPSTPA